MDPNKSKKPGSVAGGMASAPVVSSPTTPLSTTTDTDSEEMGTGMASGGVSQADDTVASTSMGSVPSTPAASTAMPPATPVVDEPMPATTQAEEPTVVGSVDEESVATGVSEEVASPVAPMGETVGSKPVMGGVKAPAAGPAVTTAETATATDEASTVSSTMMDTEDATTTGGGDTSGGVSSV